MKRKLFFMNFKPGNDALKILIIFLIVLLQGSVGICADFSSETRDQILWEYFPNKLVQKMRKDARPIRAKFDGINIFSSAQYGDKFLTGYINIGDVFDARNPVNMRIFREYARDNFLIKNVDESDHFNKYAEAAHKFLEEFGFDAVIFYPDEFHPVFTRPHDTWMFIREEPSGKKEGPYYYSCRMKNRDLAVTGGIKMEPGKLKKHAQYYFPSLGTRYDPYKMLKTEALPDSKNSRERIFKPVKVSDEIREKRKKLGIIPSRLSGRKNLLAGLWTGGDKIRMEYQVGPSFKATGKEYSWGDRGFYAIPLDRDFWE